MEKSTLKDSLQGITKIPVIGERPSHIPETWIVFNAPRPLYGHEEWQGEFQHGIFYVAVDPDGYGAEGFIRESTSLDGWLVEYWTVENALKAARRHLLKKYPEEGEAIDCLNEIKLMDTFYYQYETL